MAASTTPPLEYDAPLGIQPSRHTTAPPLAATRHLSAAAYIDEKFCRTAMVEVYQQGRRLTAPSYGFDLPTVLHHCRRARAGYVWRDVWVTGTVAAGLFSIVGIPALVMLAALLLYLRQARQAGRQVRETVHAIRSGTQGVARSARRMLESVAVCVLGLLPVGVCSALIFSPVTMALLATLPVDSPGAEQVLRNVQISTVLIVLSVFGTTIGTGLWRQRQLDSLAPQRPMAAPRLNRRLKEIAAQQDSNVTVYPGKEPFIGSGRRLADWGTSIRMVQASDTSSSRPEPATAERSDDAWWKGREFGDAPFRADDLVTHVQRRLLELIDNRADDGFTVESRVFRAASRLTNQDLSPSDHVVRDVIRNPTKRARHYLACRVVSRDGELVTQVYLAFAVQRASLYTELTAYALVPCVDEYRVIDNVGGTGRPAQRRAFWRGLLDAPETVGHAPLRLVGALLDWAPTVPGTLRRRRRRRVYDRGVSPSLRELVSASMEDVAFCHSDIRKHLRTIERQAIAVVYEFLESRGVDISEYRQRTITILNEGILNTGVLTAEGAVVAGMNAQVNTGPTGEKS